MLMKYSHPQLSFFSIFYFSIHTLISLLITNFMISYFCNYYDWSKKNCDSCMSLNILYTPLIYFYYKKNVDSLLAYGGKSVLVNGGPNTTVVIKCCLILYKYLAFYGIFLTKNIFFLLLLLIWMLITCIPLSGK